MGCHKTTSSAPSHLDSGSWTIGSYQDPLNYPDATQAGRMEIFHGGNAKLSGGGGGGGEGLFPCKREEFALADSCWLWLGGCTSHSRRISHAGPVLSMYKVLAFRMPSNMDNSQSQTSTPRNKQSHVQISPRCKHAEFRWAPRLPWSTLSACLATIPTALIPGL